ncbi:MAG: hypothetical protein V3V05_12405 [Pontiella sp.]
MKYKLAVPWTVRLALSRLFQWHGGNGRTNASDPKLLKEDDLDHLGALHTASMQTKKR